MLYWKTAFSINNNRGTPIHVIEKRIGSPWKQPHLLFCASWAALPCCCRRWGLAAGSSATAMTWSTPFPRLPVKCGKWSANFRESGLKKTLPLIEVLDELADKYASSSTQKAGCDPRVDHSLLRFFKNAANQRRAFSRFPLMAVRIAAPNTITPPIHGV
ncbi:hypothetical protein M2298_005359 [Brevibacillus sp. 1238]|nr:hypothetical protein [Brevibacillus sp. 1238]